ncbi:hypothetical protein [Natronorubrum sp. A-ect3]|uniref:hypothetical protein n=1 Tax=Natronorubrum sp. A-ect3 TaxID=3242698 RepID=UPI00359CED1A
MSDDTSIRVSEKLADELYNRKGRGTSYEDCIWKLLEKADAYDELQEQEQPPEPRERVSEDVDDGVTEADESVDETTSHPLKDVLETIDVPGSGTKATARREAVRAAMDHIREHGAAQPNDLREHVYPDHPAKYETANSWWKNCVYKGLVQLAERDDRLEKADTTGVWSWNDTDA